MQKIFVVVLHYRDVKNSKACVASLQASILPKDVLLQILVVDNNSPEPYILDAKEKKDGILLHKNEKNLGFSGGMNSGISYALSNQAEYIVIINNDTLVDKNLILRLYNRLKSSKEIGLVVPKIYFYPKTEFHFDRYKEQDRGKVIWYAGGQIDWKNVLASHFGVDEVDTGQFSKSEETNFATGCCMAFQAKAIERLKGFDDNYYLYFEDIDLSMRMKKEGFKVVFEPNAFLWHKNAKSSGGAGSVLQDYFISRNRLLFGMRYASLRAKISLLRESIKIFLTGRTWQKKGVLDFYLHKFHQGSFPIK